MKNVAIIVILALIVSTGAIQAQEQFEYVSSTLFHDQFHSIAKIGNYVYCQGENGLQIINVQDPADPVIIKNIDNLNIDRMARYSQPIDSLLYTSYGHYLKIFNVSDALSPEFVGSYETEFGNIKSAVIDGNTAYLVTDSVFIYEIYFIRIIDVSSPDNPRLLSTLRSTYHLGLCPVNGFLYILYTFDFHPNGMYIYDVSDPAEPVLLSDTDFGYFLPYDMAIFDNYAIIAGEFGMLIVDISDPQNPEIIMTIEEYSSLENIIEQGDIAYISTGSTDQPGFHIYSFNMIDPVAPEFLGQYETDLHISNILLENEMIYFLGYRAIEPFSSALGIVDFFNPYEPLLTGLYEPPSAVLDVMLHDDYAFIANDYSGLQVIGIADPFDPILGTNIPTSGSAEDIFISGNIAYLTNSENGLLIFDIADPAQPVQAAHFQTENSLIDVSIDGSYAYLIITDYYDFDAIVLDVNDPYNPSFVSIFEDIEWPAVIEVSDHVAYILSDFNLELIDFSDPLDPTPISTYALGNRGYGLCVRDSLVYVTCGDGVKIIDVSIPTNPILAGEYPLDAAAAVTVHEDYAYISRFDDKLEVIDISNPSEPFFVADYLNAGSINEVSVRGDYVYVAAEKYFLILRLAETGLEEVGKTYPSRFALAPNFPNPFNASTAIRYDLPVQSDVLVEIYDLLGRKIETLTSGIQPAGSHSVIWNAEDVSSGVYFYRIEAGDFVETRKCVLLK